MPHPGSLTPRMRAAIVAACFACVLTCGALVHPATHGSDAARSHCNQCACVQAVVLAGDTPNLAVGFEDAGGIAPDIQPATGLLRAAKGVTRAPPRPSRTESR